MSKNIVYMLVFLLLVTATLISIGIVRYQDFKAYHEALAQEAASSLASEVQRFVEEKKRLVGLFAHQHANLIEPVLQDSMDEERYLRLESLIAAYFPNYFSFMLADAQGRPVIDDIEGLVGGLCRDDIRHFAATREQAPRVHPHSEVYHFDVMAELSADNQPGILFVSFNADIVGEAIRNIQLPSHQLMLVYPQGEDLIEITRDGSRINWERMDYRLSDSEKARILVRRRIENTRWQAVDFIQPGIFQAYIYKVVIHSVLILLLFLVVSGVMINMIRKEERRRRAAEKQKDEFLSIISHELRTPLTSIKGSLALLVNGVVHSTDDRGHKMASIALSNSERLASLIDDLLDLQKIDAGRMDYDKRPVRLDAFIEGCLESNQGYADERQVDFFLRQPLPDVVVEIDELRMAQVMANLLSNAAKYGAKQDDILVAVTEHRGYVRISVEDHGQGIAEKDRSRLFEKFSQLDASDRRVMGGSGLGLSIVKSIVEAHDGRVGYHSTPGEGTTFYVDLPIAGGGN